MAGSFTKTVSSFKLTATGKRKLKRMQSATLDAIEHGMVRTMPKYKQLLASFSPTIQQEKELLSEGTVFEGRTIERGAHAGQFAVTHRQVGTYTGGRFLRAGGQMSTREAIAASSVVVKKNKALGRVTVTTARAREINRMTAFSWRTRHRGIQSTEPYDHQLMQAYEYGGAWEIRRRSTALLNPEPGVLAGRMIKTLAPWRMYQNARVAIQDELAANVKADVEAALKKI